MGNASKFTMDISDNSIVVTAPPAGVVFVEGITEMGPVNDPVDIITSSAHYKRIFGGLLNDSDFPLLCMRMLDKGTSLRINRICDAAAVPAEAVILGPVGGSTEELFKLYSKYPGSKYNSMTAVVSDASNGKAGYFNLTITLGTIVELYENLQITTTTDTSFLDKVLKYSTIARPKYSETATTNLIPTRATYTFIDGDNGDPPVLADYVGVKADGTGFHAFNDYTDGYILSLLDLSEEDLDGITSAGEAYVKARKDLMYFQHLDNTMTSASTLITARGSIASKYLFFTAGGLKIYHPTTSELIEISETADVIAQANFVHNSPNLGVYRSFAGPTFGVINDVVGVVNNFGSPSFATDLNLLANNQVNMVVSNQGIFLNDDYTGQVVSSSSSFANVVFLTFYLRRALTPTLRAFLKYPAVFSTFETIYYTAKPFMDSLLDKAYYTYSWQGDQFAKTLAGLTVNTPAGLQQGKYKVKVKADAIAPITEFELDFSLEMAGSVK